MIKERIQQVAAGKRYQQVKLHLQENKKVYVAAAGGVTFAGITCLIVRGRHAGVPSVSDGPVKVAVRPLSFFSKQTTNVVSVIERDGRGHPGYLVRCLETGETFISQAEAARMAGTSAANMSSHLNGKFPDVFGFHFERIGTTG